MRKNERKKLCSSQATHKMSYKEETDLFNEITDSFPDFVTNAASISEREDNNIEDPTLNYGEIEFDSWCDIVFCFFLLVSIKL